MRIKRRESVLIVLSLPKHNGKKTSLSLSLRTMASSIVEEEEVAAEVEAVQAVYGDDCVVLQSYPPHLHLLLKPRTADVTSQQVSLSLYYFLSLFGCPENDGKYNQNPEKIKEKLSKSNQKTTPFALPKLLYQWKKEKRKKISKSQNFEF